MAVVSMRELLEAGVHFGHQTRRWNPKMRRFIFTERGGIYIIDLQQTAALLEEAAEFARNLAGRGGSVLFVGTKKQAQEVVEEQAKRSQQFFVTQRWLGGMLTNFKTLKQSIDRLKKLEEMLEDAQVAEALTKKELGGMRHEREKLLSSLGGIKGLRKLPDAIFVIDPKKEEIAVKEANKLGIPVVAIVDTNADPDVITVPVPGNDDAIRSVSLITAALADVIKEARAQMPMREVTEDLEAETYSSDAGSEGDADADRKRRRPRRKRRPKPEAIAARLKTEGEAAAEPAPASAGEGA